MGQFLLLVVMALTVGAVVFGVTVLLTGGDRGLSSAEPDGQAVPLPGTRPLVESDIAGVRFDTALRGYRMAQVDQAMRRTAYDIGYKDELINVLEAEVAALRSGRFSDAEVLRRAREAAQGTSPTDPEPAVDAIGAPAEDEVEIDLGTVNELPEAAREEAPADAAAGDVVAGEKAAERAVAESGEDETQPDEAASGAARFEAAARSEAAANPEAAAKAAKPEGTAKPEETAKSDNTAKPEEIGKLDETAMPEGIGKPEGTARSDETAKSDDTAKSEETGKSEEPRSDETESDSVLPSRR